MKDLLRVWIPFLPPSSNKIYEPAWVRGKPRGKRLSGAGRKFKIKAMQVLQKGGRVALLDFKEHIPYELILAVFLPRVVNKGWAAGKADNRYTKVDVTNRIKLIEDTVADAIGVDDRHNFRVSLEKHCDPDHPGIYVRLAKVPEKEVGLTKEDYEVRLRQPEPHRTGGVGSAAWFSGASSRTRESRTDRPDRGANSRRRRPR